VFGDGAVPSLNTLQVHVSQLRSLLSPHGAALQHVGGGYRLDPALVRTDAAELDSVIADRGRTPAEAIRWALAAWRGRFCEDVDVPGLEGRRAYYDGLRLDALELLFEAELQAGARPDLPERIEAVLREEPLRERLWGQLMLALYATGRQTAALHAYQRARATLSEEAGVDPGPALRELESLILRQAETVDRVSPVMPVSSVPSLVWLDATGALRAHPLVAAKPVVVGRSRDCDIVIDWDPLVSRRHADVTGDRGRFVVRDLGSRNGTAVDGHPVPDEGAQLALRGTLQVGATPIYLRGPSVRVDSRRLTRAVAYPGAGAQLGTGQEEVRG
jgi:hypothetical protein